MKDKYLELVGLQIETTGSTFVMGYSLRSGKHYIQFHNKHKRIESYYLEEAITMAIDFIKETRQYNKARQAYTLFKFNNDLKTDLISHESK